ncbi:hypothetical protein EST62_04315 [Chlorobaculum sp. 24CR]|uniref:hypothetical protein n=1 Tax=Chlorobaculum sp. 24CR TaxID=2508878 RepID=UPI00100BB7FC|nr:hypothetical protein [Chlorobaculum sp. 24CR]RXK88102.1 hypothetical protein EST62_04315 [Chlorobaculum sp. 24CR]
MTAAFCQYSPDGRAVLDAVLKISGASVPRTDKKTGIMQKVLENSKRDMRRVGFGSSPGSAERLLGIFWECQLLVYFDLVLFCDIWMVLRLE